MPAAEADGDTVTSTDRNFSCVWHYDSFMEAPRVVSNCFLARPRQTGVVKEHAGCEGQMEDEEALPILSDWM